MKRPWLWFVVPAWLRDTLEEIAQEMQAVRESLTVIYTRQEHLMGLAEDLAAKVAEVQATVDATQAAVQLAVANLKAEIQSLKDQLAGAGPSGDPVLEAAVADSLAKMEAIVVDLQTETLPPA